MGRAPCCEKVGLKKGPWTPEEDTKLIEYIQMHGPGNWRTLPKNAGLQRCGKSCRLRWTNYLRPDIKRGRFTFEEEEAIIQLHSVMGNKWSAIAARLPGRTDNEIKNYWNTHIRKRLLRNGIDPVTHRPRFDLLDLSSLLSSSLHNTGLINLSSMLSSQTLVDPQLLTLVNTLSSLKQENPALYLQILQENQQMNTSQACDTSCNPDLFRNQPQGMQMNDMANYNFPASQNISCPSLADQNFVAQQNYNNAIFGYSEQMNLQPQMKNCNQNLNQNSFISTPSSNSTPLNSSTTLINGSAEDEWESYCSSLLKFEIPEGLDVSELL